MKPDIPLLTLPEAIAILDGSSPSPTEQLVLSRAEALSLQNYIKRLAVGWDAERALNQHHRTQIETLRARLQEYQAELQRVTERLATVETAYQAVVDVHHLINTKDHPRSP